MSSGDGQRCGPLPNTQSAYPIYALSVSDPQVVEIVFPIRAELEADNPKNPSTSF